MVDIERRDLIKGVGAVPLGVGLSGVAEAQETSGGEEIWSFETGFSVNSSPTVVDGTVYVGSSDTNLYAVDAMEGTELWRYETDASIGDSSPTVVDGIVYVGSVDNTGENNLYAVDASSGDEVWSFETGDTMTSSPTVVDNTVYIGSRDNNLYAVDASSGEEEWRFQTGDAVNSSPIVVDGTVYVSSEDNNLYAVDASSGEEFWNFETDDSVFSSSPTFVEDTVYVGFSNLYAVDASSGEEMWTFEIFGEVTSSPTVVDDIVYVGSGEYLIAVDTSSGEEEWRFETGDSVFSSPTASEGIVYVGSRDGNLYAVDASSGEEIWRFGTEGTDDTEDDVDSSPTVVNGTVYVGSRDNNLYAVDAGVSGSSEDSRVLQGTLGHHDSFAEQGPLMPSEYDRGSGGLAGGGGNGDTDSIGSSSNQDGTSGAGGDTNQAGLDDSPLGGIATMFQEPSENAGAWGAILGGGVLGAGYLAYRRRDSDDEKDEAVARQCPECGSRVAASNTFCGNCGAQVDEEETDTEPEEATEQTVQVSEYSDLTVGEVVETGSGYQVHEASIDGMEESVWVVTPLTEASQTLDVSQTEDFLEEIETWAKMDDHPNLLQIYGHGTEPLPWLAVEPAEYLSMRDVANDLSEDQKVEVLSQICEAVHHVHRYGIVYENLSPESVRVTDESQVKLRGALDYLGGVADTEMTERDIVHRIGNIAKYLLTSSERDEIQEEIDRSLSDNPTERHDTVLHFRDDLKQAYEQG